jgi:glucuronate isomerase
MGLPEDRYFSPDPAQKRIAQQLYEGVKALPLICPHGHVDPKMFADPDYSFGTPADLLIIPDHYVYRMLYSQGIPLESLGIPRLDRVAVETDHRRVWQIFAEHFYLFRGTPTGMWLTHELEGVFGVKEKLNGDTAQAVYEQIAECLVSPAFRPRALYERFNIEVLCTTDPATSRLESHRAIRESGWQARILPTFRPDAVINLDTLNWRSHIDALSEASGITVDSYRHFIQALEAQRAHFKSLGATATDHAALTPYTDELSDRDAEQVFARALQNALDPGDAERFTAHMLIQMARMSVEDGLVMQLHVGALRDYNTEGFRRFGPNTGADIPISTDFTHNLRPLLERFGSNPRLTLILFTLDESTYSRELAPLAGYYPALRLGPPWWFHDSFNGLRRYFDQVIETAGLYNTAGFNDDTRAFPSIPARHDLWRRAAADWLAGLTVRSIIDEEDASSMMHSCAYDLAKQAYRLD